MNVAYNDNFSYYLYSFIYHLCAKNLANLLLRALLTSISIYAKATNVLHFTFHTKLNVSVVSSSTQKSSHISYHPLLKIEEHWEVYWFPPPEHGIFQFYPQCLSESPSSLLILTTVIFGLLNVLVQSFNPLLTVLPALSF